MKPTIHRDEKVGLVLKPTIHHDEKVGLVLKPTIHRDEKVGSFLKHTIHRDEKVIPLPLVGIIKKTALPLNRECGFKNKLKQTTNYEKPLFCLFDINPRVDL